MLVSYNNLNVSTLAKIILENKNDNVDISDIDFLPDEYEDKLDDILKEDEWVILNFEKYKMIHGFPGDNPAGYIYDPITYKVLLVIGDGNHQFSTGDVDAENIYDWYENITNDGCEYEEIYFYRHDF